MFINQIFLKLLLSLRRPRWTRQVVGQGMVEYALLLMLIGTVVLVVLIVLGNQVHNVFNNVSCAISKLGASCAPPPPED